MHWADIKNGHLEKGGRLKKVEMGFAGFFSIDRR